MDEMMKGRERIKKGEPLIADVPMKKLDGTEAKLADLLGGTTLIYYFHYKIDTSGKIAEFYRGLPEDTRNRLTKSLSQLTSAKTP